MELEEDFNGDTPRMFPESSATVSPAHPLHQPPRTVARRATRRGKVVRVSTPAWHEPVRAALARRYEMNGWGRALLRNDMAMLRRVCNGKHPAETSTADLEEVVLRAKTLSSRGSYVARLRSIFNSLRIVGAIPPEHCPDAGLPKLRRARGVPRPITRAQAEHLMTNAAPPFNEWFTLACLAGMRAGEISRLEGQWLELHPEGPVLRIFGKGSTELTVPAHEQVARIVESHRTLGRLYRVNPNKVSSYASAEMKRLGVPGTLHACRHYFATELLEQSGGDLILVAELMRHASLDVTRGYAQLRQGRKRAVLDLLGGGSDGSLSVVAP